MRLCLIQHLLEESCRRFPDKICVEEKAGSASYQDVLQKAQLVSRALVTLGVGKGDHIGVMLPRSISQVLSLIGVLFAGGVFIVINPILKDEQVVHMIEDCGIKTILISHDLAIKNAAVLKNAGVRNAVVFQGSGNYGFKKEIPVDWEAWKSLAPIPDPCLVTDDTSHIIYTSGSTGKPKGIVISHRNTIDGAKIVSEYTGLHQDDVVLGSLPFNFDYGLNQLMNTFYVGATIYLHHFFMTNDLLRILESKKITVFAGMAPIWTKIFNPKLTDLSRQYDFSNLRVITNTGGKVPVSIVTKMRSFFPQSRIFLMYGLTEAFRSTYLDPDEIDRRPESMGKAVPNVEIHVLNKDGKECAPFEEGELVHRGALISKGYWNNPQKTKEVFRPNPLLGKKNAHLETVVYSGDIVKRDNEGFLYYIGRRDAMIKTKGYRVSPAEVEELVVNMDGVTDCIAAGYVRDETILLRVFVLTDSSSLTSEDILQYCKKQFPFYLVPDDVVLSDRFPLTSNGKVDRERIIREHEDA